MSSIKPGAASLGASSNMGGSFSSQVKSGKESRASEALKMKDEQLRILSEQNTQLLETLDRVEGDANAIQLEKLAVGLVIFWIPNFMAVVFSYREIVVVRWKKKTVH
jgi:hypothetical protein